VLVKLTTSGASPVLGRTELVADSVGVTVIVRGVALTRTWLASVTLKLAVYVPATV
jgi:hypothetical protein